MLDSTSGVSGRLETFSVEHPPGSPGADSMLAASPLPYEGIACRDAIGLRADVSRAPPEPVALILVVARPPRARLYASAALFGTVADCVCASRSTRTTSFPPSLTVGALGRTSAGSGSCSLFGLLGLAVTAKLYLPLSSVPPAVAFVLDDDGRPPGRVVCSQRSPVFAAAILLLRSP